MRSQSGAILVILGLITLCFWVLAITFANLATPESGKNLITEFYRSLVYERWVQTSSFKEEKNIDLTEFDSLCIHFEKGNIEISETSEPQLRIEVKGEMDQRFEGKSVIWYEKNGTQINFRFEIPETEKGGSGGLRKVLHPSQPFQIRLQLPVKKWKMQISGEGNLIFKNQTMEDLKIVGGDLSILLQKVLLDDLKVVTKKGSLRLDHVQGKKAKVILHQGKVENSESQFSEFISQ